MFCKEWKVKKAGHYIFLMKTREFGTFSVRKVIWKRVEACKRRKTIFLNVRVVSFDIFHVKTVLE